MSFRSRLTASVTVIAMLAPLGGETVFAQDITLEEIVVSAQRRTENLQDTPIAVTALSELQMERRNVTETIDLGRQVPLLIAYNNVTLGASLAYWLRGIGSTESLSTFDPPVLTYVDEIANPRQNANNLELFEVERLEVLRGPQGTLFGRNTTGGAVNIISKKPTDEFSAQGELGYGRFQEFRTKLGINIPITDKLFTKWSAYYIEDDGWQESVVTGEKFNFAEALGLRAAVRFVPTDNVTWDTSVNWYTQDHQNIQSQVNAVTSEGNFEAGQDGPWTYGSPRRNGVFLNNCKTGDGPLEWVRNNCTANETEGYDIISNLAVDLGDTMAVNIITGYTNLNHNFVSPLFAGPLELPLSNEGSHNMFSQEIKFTGEVANINYVTGFFYMREDNFTQFETSLMFAPNSAPLSLDNNIMENDTVSLAWYAQGDFPITDRLMLTAGVRWTDEAKKIPFYQNIVKGFDLDDIRAANIPDKVTSVQWTPRFVLQYDLSDDAMVFASATRGFKSGGWNGRAGAANLMTRFNEETVWSYELGARTEWVDNRVRANFTIFDVTYAELQLPSLAFQPAEGEAPTFVNNNAGTLGVTGLEVELSALLADGFNVYANLGFQDANYNRLSPGAQVAGFILGVTRPQRAPKFTGQFGIDYTRYVDGLSGDVSFAADVQMTSSFWMSGQNPPDSFNEGFDTMNANLAWNHEDGSWGIALSCKNCLDERYLTTDFLNARFIGDPLRWSLRLKFAY